MKEFNLELAKQGHPVCTRDGRKARIVCTDYKSIGADRPILALIEQENDTEEVVAFKNNGSFGALGISDYELMMASVKHEGWTHIYSRDNGRKPVIGRAIFATKEEAMETARHHKTEDRIIDTIHIEWKE